MTSGIRVNLHRKQRLSFASEQYSGERPCCIYAMAYNSSRCFCTMSLLTYSS